MTAALTTTTPASLARLPESARTLASASIAPATRRAYASALARLDAWLVGRELDDATVAANGGGSVAGLRDAAVVALMSDAMLRVSECAALDVQDLATEADGSGRLAIRHSKTDQEGEGAVQFVGEPTVRRVRAWLEAAGIEAGAMFLAVRRGGHVQDARITARALRTIVAKRAADAGVEGRVSGHSLRVGSAQSLAAAGAGVVEMQVAGRWKSERQPGRYARAQLAGRGAVARLRYGA